jgi:CheY-like chemotaxis protein
VFSFGLDAPLAPPQEAGDAGEEPAGGLGPGRVLVVDDNAVNALVAQTMLTRLGLASETARDGEEALARMAATRYDLVLMDCRMPRLDGLEATRRWRAAEAGAPRLPIIGVTANVSAEDRRQCLDSGMDGFLGKPFLLEDLRAQLLPHLRAQNRGA